MTNYILVLLSLFLVQASFAGVYDLPIPFQTDAGKKVTLADWNQQISIMSMAYTSCKGSCPVIIAKLKSLDDKLKEKKIQANFLIATFDPQIDTPKVITDYLNKTNFHRQNFTFLVASAADTRKLSMHLGIRFSKEDDGTIQHDNKIVALSKSGKIIATQENLNQSFDEFIAKVVHEAR